MLLGFCQAILWESLSGLKKARAEPGFSPVLGDLGSHRCISTLRKGTNLALTLPHCSLLKSTLFHVCPRSNNGLLGLNPK